MTVKSKPDAWQEIKKAVASKGPNLASNMEKQRDKLAAKGR